MLNIEVVLLNLIKVIHMKIVSSAILFYNNLQLYSITTSHNL